jgi:antirestriction protein ArdC
MHFSFINVLILRSPACFDQWPSSVWLIWEQEFNSN